MTTDIDLRYARRGDVPRLCALMGYAFQTDPVSRWLFPDDTERAVRHPAFFSVFLRQAISGGSVLRTVDFRAVALWLDIDPDNHEPNDTNLRRQMAEVCGASYPRFEVLDQLLAQRHPTSAPHAHLTFIAVAPRLWGRGLGTAVLRHKLTQLDLSNTPAYLDASSPRSRDLYQRHGFTDLDAPVSLPDGPQLYPMWRPPNPPPQAGPGKAAPACRLDGSGTGVHQHDPTGGGWVSGWCAGGPDAAPATTTDWVNQRRYHPAGPAELWRS